jgi:hypothetical protein
MKGTIRPMARDLETGLVKVSGIEVLIAGEQNDLYFQQCLEQRSLFEPSVATDGSKRLRCSKHC